MDLYTKLYLSLFIMLPYVILQTELYSEFKLFLSKLFHKEINKIAFKIIISFYFVLYLLTLIVGFFEVIILEMIAGLFTITGAMLFYKPYSEKRDNFFNYLPSLDIVFIFIIGQWIFLRGLIKIIKKIRNFCCENNIDFTFYISLNNNPIHSNSYIKANDLTIELTDDFLMKTLFYLFNHKLKDLKLFNKVNDLIRNKLNIEIGELNKNTLKIEFTNYNSIIIRITNLDIKTYNIKAFKNQHLLIRGFLGEFYLLGNQIKIKKIEKGNISDLTSCIRHMLLALVPFFLEHKKLENIAYEYTTKLFIDKINKTIKEIIKDGFSYKYDIFDFQIFLKEFRVFKNTLKINLNIFIDIKFDYDNNIFWKNKLNN